MTVEQLRDEAKELVEGARVQQHAHAAAGRTWLANYFEGYAQAYGEVMNALTKMLDEMEEPKGRQETHD